jgi:hypothetical protein
MHLNFPLAYEYGKYVESRIQYLYNDDVTIYVADDGTFSLQLALLTGAVPHTSYAIVRP